MAISREDAVRRLRRLVDPLTGDPRDYDPLLEQIGDASLVLLDEAERTAGWELGEPPETYPSAL